MPSSEHPERWATWAGHIVEQIDRIHAILGLPIQLERLDIGLNAEGAVRCLEIISEATSRLHRAQVDLPRFEAGIPWRGIRAFGNVARHDYPEIDDVEVRYTCSPA